MTWTYRSDTQAAFDAWHAQYKSNNGYPLPGRNAKTGQIQPLSIGATAEYTSAVVVDPLDVRFPIDTRVLIGDEKVTTPPGRVGAAPTYKADGSLDVVKTKSDQTDLDTVVVQAVVG